LKQLYIMCILCLLTTLAFAGSGKLSGDMSVLTLLGDTTDMTGDQIVELQRVGAWMDKDIIKRLKKTGLNAKLIDSKEDYKGSGHLLMIEVTKFNAGNRAARAFVGFGAGASSLDLKYTLLDNGGTAVSTWEDGVGSSKGGTYCAQKLDKNAVKKLKVIMK